MITARPWSGCRACAVVRRAGRRRGSTGRSLAARKEPDRQRRAEQRHDQRRQRREQDRASCRAAPGAAHAGPAARASAWATALQADGPGGLDQHDVARPQLAAQQRDRGRARPARAADSPFHEPLGRRRGGSPAASGPTTTSRAMSSRTASRPTASCSAMLSAPSSRHLAEHRPPSAGPRGHRRQRAQAGAHRLRVGVVRVVDDRHAVRARSATSIRQRLTRLRRGERSATAGSGIAQLQGDGGGGQRVGDLVLAVSRQPPPRRRPAGGDEREAGRPASSSVTSAARTSAAAPVPKVTTRAAVRAAIAATSGSSAFSTASPSAGSASTSSPLARATASRLPNSPRCATADVEHDADVGRAIRHRRRCGRRPRAPISSTRKRVCSVGPQDGQRERRPRC